MITLKKFHLPRPLERGLFKRQQVRGFSAFRTGRNPFIEGFLL